MFFILPTTFYSISIRNNLKSWGLTDAVKLPRTNAAAGARPPLHVGDLDDFM